MRPGPTGRARPGQDAAYVIDSAKARSESGWRPGIGFEDDIGKAVDRVEANRDQVREQPLEYMHKP